jgi:hypothetical protein
VVAGSAFRVQQPGAGTRDWRGQGVTTARTIGAVLRGSTGAHVVCSDLRSVGRALHGARRWPARHFSSDSRSPADPTTARDDSSDSASLAVDIMRRQIAIIADRRHHATTICGKLVTERPMRWPLPVCADPARKCRGLDAASTSHEQVGLCAMQCLLCNACQACDGDVVLLNALLCVHGAHA